MPTKPFTHKQGQYLAFIYYYSKVNGRPPAEADMQRYFQVSPPSIHQMILALEANGFIERVPGQGRSIRLLILAKHFRIWNSCSECAQRRYKSRRSCILVARFVDAT